MRMLSHLSFFVAFTTLASVFADTTLYQGYRTCIGTATSDQECYNYAYNTDRQQAGFGYLFYNPNVCGEDGVNLVGCTPGLNFTKYANYYNNLANPTKNAQLAAFRSTVMSTIRTYGAPMIFSHNYCVTNCMFCKLLDSYSTNLDPFCPGEVCEDYGLPLSKCLAKIPDPFTNGISIQTLAPVASDNLDIDTEYDISFSVYGVSNSDPYIGMPIGIVGEGCPNGVATRGLDAVPTGFTFQPSYSWLKANTNKVTILLKDGTRRPVECVSTSPNGGIAERVVVFVGRDLGTPQNPPVQIYIQGPVLMSNGQNTTTTMMSSAIGTLDQGTLMLYAESYTEANFGTAGWASFFTPATYVKSICPSDTTVQIVVTTWTKGTRQTHPGLMTLSSTGLQGWTSQADGVEVTLEDNTVLKGSDGDFTIADDDDDNYVHVCLKTTVKATSVSFARGLFFDPRNTMNAAQSIKVNDPLPLYDPYPILNPNSVTNPVPRVTITPTKAPSAAPTVTSTGAPTVTPTKRTRRPSRAPTAAPTTKFQLSSRPTKFPKKK